MPTFQPLTQDQVNFFHTFGYLHLPGWFRDEIGTLAEAFDRQFEHHKSEVLEWTHEAHYNKTRKILMHMPDRDPALFSLLADDRLQDIGKKLAGQSFLYMPSEGNIFSGDTIWHTDEYNPYLHLPEGHVYFKVALYLDPMTRQNGGFRVIPGSHHPGAFYKLLQTHLKDNIQAYGITPEQVPCVTLENQPGDILIFNYRTQHATCGTTHPRRMLYFGMTAPFTTETRPLAKKTAKSLENAFGCIYKEPLASTSQPLIKEAIQPLLTISGA